MGLDSELPSEIGKLVKVAYDFKFRGNKFCGQIPTEILALSDGVTTGWQVR